MQDNKKYIEIDFYKLWRHVRLTREQKENTKYFLFSKFTVLFIRFAAYQNWKNSQIFAKNRKEETTNEITSYNIINNNIGVKHNNKLAIVIHVFYMDVFQSILSDILINKTYGQKLFITCPKGLRSEIESLLKEKKANYDIFLVENHGRDILPFLKVLPLVLKQDFDIILKIHTKRSNHLNRKKIWAHDIFEKLINDNSSQNVLNIFNQHPEIGMIGPEGHILPMSLYYGGNAINVVKLCLKMGLKQNQLQGLNFVAGSMFYARKEALIPILKMNLSERDFEGEDRQLDNTMAHAVERVFSVGLILSGLKLADTSSTPTYLSCKTTNNHHFTI
jgi:lipopolysaccharide biosynthesis protein